MKWSGAFFRTPEFNVILFSFLVNLPWEFWQVPFFRGIAELPHWLGVQVCTRATFGDAGIALAAFWVAAAFAGSRAWIIRPRRQDIATFMGVGLMVTIALETLATGALDRWSYGEMMPRLPVLGTGLLPLLQWLALPPLVIWIVRRQIRTPDA